MFCFVLSRDSDVVASDKIVKCMLKFDTNAAYNTTKLRYKQLNTNLQSIVHYTICAHIHKRLVYLSHPFSTKNISEFMSTLLCIDIAMFWDASQMVHFCDSPSFFASNSRRKLESNIHLCNQFVVY